MASAGFSAGNTLDPQTTAVVCVECQNGVIGPDSILPQLAADTKDLVAGLSRLLKGAREAGVLVVQATFEGTFGARELGTAPLWRVTGPASSAWGPGHPATQVVPELFDPTDLVLPRHHGLSATCNTELLPVLRGRGIRTLVLAGVSLNVALPLTAGEAEQEGFRVVVPRDAVGASPAEYGEQVLRHTMSKLGKVVTVDDLVSGWAKTVAQT